jgi:hypothetical protein
MIMMKFSWAISQVKWLSSEQTNVSKTISVLVLRVLVWSWNTEVDLLIHCGSMLIIIYDESNLSISVTFFKQNYRIV